jgi:hypothetical protein
MESKMAAKLCLCVSLILCIAACSKVKNESDIFGTYVADYNIAKEKITLNKDGTFTQEVILKATSKADTTKGKWSFDKKTGYVSFSENYMAVLNGFKQLNPDYSQKLTSAYLPADTYLGDVVVGVAEGVLYKKVSE